MVLKFIKKKRNGTVYFVAVRIKDKKKQFSTIEIREVTRYGLGPGSWEDKRMKMYDVEGYGEVESLYYNGGRVEDFLNKQKDTWLDYKRINEVF
jgi:hypothetical protein